jgi:hypothetical protein
MRRNPAGGIKAGGREDRDAIIGGQPVNVDDPIEVISLVLQAASQQARPGDSDLVTVQILTDNGSDGRAGELGLLVRHRPASGRAAGDQDAAVFSAARGLRPVPVSG